METDALERYAGMSVLVVDDNPSNVALLKSLLQDNGLPRVYTETDSRRVPGLLRDYHPDLVLLDLHMPHFDGHHVLSQIKAHAAGTFLPVLVLTADTTTEARNRALGAGAQDFLTKPLDVVEATMRIANLLETRLLYADLRHMAGEASGNFAPQEAEASAIRTRIEGVLRDHTLSAVYQPIIDLTDGSTIGYEGLSRFADPGYGGPDRWFSDAFAVGLGIDLEWLAVKTVLPALDATPVDTFLAINMSPATVLHLPGNELCRPDLCRRVIIEITEHVPIEDYAAVHRALAEARGHGARLAADDLGAGYGGFRHLISLKPDIIKLDISIIRGIHLSRDQRALASALVTFAGDIGAQVIAEGVEQAEELDSLRAVGVHWAQGYYLGRPKALL